MYGPYYIKILPPKNSLFFFIRIISYLTDNIQIDPLTRGTIIAAGMFLRFARSLREELRSNNHLVRNYNLQLKLGKIDCDNCHFHES